MPNCQSFGMLKTSVLAVAAFALVLGLAECTIRLLFKRLEPLANIHLPPIIAETGLACYSSAAGFRVSPSIKDAHAFDTTVSTNSDGLRIDRELEAKPRTRVRIACYGDSLTFGNGVLASETFSAIIQEKLRSFFPRYDIEVVNMGVPGHTVLLGEQFIRETFAEVQPDIVVVQYFAEDITSSGLLDSEMAQASFIERLARRWAPVSQLASYYVSKCRKSTSSAVLAAGLPRVNAEDYLDAVKRIQLFCYREGVGFLGVGPVYREKGMGLWDVERAREYKKHLGDLSAWQEIPIHTEGELADGVGAEGERYFRDHRHLNAEGHRMLGERLASDLRRRVRTRINEIAENHPGLGQLTENE